MPTPYHVQTQRLKALFCTSLLSLGSLDVLAQAPAAPAAGAPAAGAPAAGGGGGRGRGGPAIVSPVVNAQEKTFTVNFPAPNAQSVKVVGELDGKEYPMTKGENGVWTVKVGPLPPDVYNYQINVDGVVAMDPRSPQVKLGFGNFPPANLVEIPGTETAFQDTRDVPHGSIRVETYHSKALGGIPRTMWVYTPPGYDSGTQRYPVFYLLNGSGNTDSSWIMTGRANTILDNLIAEGKAKPMILISPMGYARTGIGTGADKELSAADLTALGLSNTGANFWYAREFMQDIIPYVDGKFRTLTDADSRAIGGLSMGGGHTVQIAFPNTDTFHSIVVMSAGANNAEQNYPSFFADVPALNKKLKLLWVGAGTADFANPGAIALDKLLTDKGVKHEPLWQMQGARHEWNVWRHALRDVAPLLFR
jgi:enterochelin esterase-like enzyme